jgi:hypothetical protein
MSRKLPSDRVSNVLLSGHPFGSTAQSSKGVLDSHVAPRRGVCIQDWNDLHVAENE